MKIAVAGGTGVVGSYAVGAITAAGHEAVVLSRSRGIDLRHEAGLAQALTGVDVIIDAANPDSIGRAKATAFFTDVTARLQTAGSAQGVARLVTLSIVGIDGFSGYGYYEAKLAQEGAARAGPLPVTIVRATQFHEFPAQILSRAHLGPVAAVPVMRVQPVAARTVGDTLVQVALDPPSTQAIEIAGPQVEDLVPLARRLVRARQRRLSVIPLWVPGTAGKAMRGGKLLATATTKLVGPSFAEWLAGGDAGGPAF
jgi:uncharacterized protein YbjT (DUF2867 family)